MLFAILSGIFGIFSGYYFIDNYYNIYDQLYQKSSAFNIIPGAISEYIINIYYFIYFVILPSLLFKDSHSINYIFKIYRYVISIFLFLGFIDLFILYTFNYDLIPRHFIDGREVGLRFHSIAGEPRDAFVYLIFSFSIIKLSQLVGYKFRYDLFLLVLILIALPLTQSASGMIGVALSLIFIILHNLNKINGKKLLFGVFIFIVFGLIFYTSLQSSKRLLLYKDAFSILYNILDTGGNIPPVLLGQMPNIYPLWDRYLEMKNFNFLPSLFGTGLGSASALNNSYIGTQETLNPHANIVRLFYENGILGSFLFIYAFMKPIKRLNISMFAIQKIIIMMLFIIGSFFAHRTSTPFIFLGAIFLVYNTIINEEKLN